MSKIRDSARWEECQVRIPDVCNFNPETTVYAHLPDGSGTGKMGGKSSDLCGVYACSACHDEIDGRTSKVTAMTSFQYAMEGHMRTLRLLEQKGLLCLS